MIKLNSFVIMLLLSIPTPLLAQSTTDGGKRACQSLFEENFENYTVHYVELCNFNIFEPDVYLIWYLDDDGNQNARQCLVGDSRVRIPSILAPWQC
jgi:hypothetical protein